MYNIRLIQWALDLTPRKCIHDIRERYDVQELKSGLLPAAVSRDIADYIKDPVTQSITIELIPEEA